MFERFLVIVGIGVAVVMACTGLLGLWESTDKIDPAATLALFIASLALLRTI